MNANTAQAIESEAAHQKAKWGDRAHSIPEWLLILDKLTQDAKRAWVTQNGDESAKHEIRQIATTAIACMDQCGTVDRTMLPPHQQRVIDECEDLEARARKPAASMSADIEITKHEKQTAPARPQTCGLETVGSDTEGPCAFRGEVILVFGTTMPKTTIMRAPSPQSAIRIPQS